MEASLVSQSPLVGVSWGAVWLHRFGLHSSLSLSELSNEGDSRVLNYFLEKTLPLNRFERRNPNFCLVSTRELTKSEYGPTRRRPPKEPHSSRRAKRSLRVGLGPTLAAGATSNQKNSKSTRASVESRSRRWAIIVSRPPNPPRPPHSFWSFLLSSLFLFLSSFFFNAFGWSERVSPGFDPRPVFVRSNPCRVEQELKYPRNYVKGCVVSWELINTWRVLFF